MRLSHAGDTLGTVLQSLAPDVRTFILERSNQAFYLYTLTGPGPSLTFVSPHMERFTGCSPVELLAKPDRFTARLHPDDVASFARQTTAILESRQDGVRRYRLRDAHDRYRHLEDWMISVVGAGGTVDAYLGILRDVTALMDADARVQDLARAAIRAGHVEASGALGEHVAHKVRNALTVILGHTAALKAALEDDRGTAAGIADIEAAVAKAEAHLEDLLAYQQRRPLTPRPIDPAAQVTALDALLRQVAGNLELALEDGTWPISMNPVDFDRLCVWLVTRVRAAATSATLISLSVMNARFPEEASAAEDQPTGDYVCVRVQAHRVSTPLTRGLDVEALVPLVLVHGGFMPTRQAGEPGVSVYLPRHRTQ